jgi:hypothetical protein
MKYTISKEADKKIEKNLKKIKEVIVRELNPISIILFGGLGKGEGSLHRGKLFNDIDIYVVTKDKISEKRLEEVGIKASKMIKTGGIEFIENSDELYDAKKFFHVDLRCIKYSDIPKLKKTTRAFEIKYSSQILYGEDIRPLIKVEKKDLSLSEGLRHLFNKSCFLLMTIDERRLKGKFLKDEKKYLIYHCIKTFLGCAEALLLAKKDDAPTYTERNKLFKKYYGKEFPELARKVDFATKMKFNLKFEKIKNPLKFWKEARDFLDFTLKYIAKNNLKIEFKDRRELIKKLYKKLPYIYFEPYIPLNKITFFSQYFLNFLYFKRTGYWKTLLTWRDPGIRIFFPAYLLLFSLEEPELKEEAKKYLKKIARIKNDSWEGLRRSVLNAYGAYYSQKLL